MSASVCTHAYNYTLLLSSYLPTNATPGRAQRLGGSKSAAQLQNQAARGEFIYATALRKWTSKSSTNRRLVVSRPTKRAARCASSPPVTVPEPSAQRFSSREPSPASTDPCAKTWSRRASAARAAPLRAPRCRWVRSQTRVHNSLPWRRLVSSASRVPPATDAEHPTRPCSHRGADRATLRAPQIAASVGVALGGELIERQPRSSSVRRARACSFRGRERSCALLCSAAASSWALEGVALGSLRSQGRAADSPLGLRRRRRGQRRARGARRIECGSTAPGAAALGGSPLPRDLPWPQRRQSGRSEPCATRRARGARGSGCVGGGRPSLSGAARDRRGR